MGFSGPELISDSQRQWKGVLYSDESTFQLVSGKNGCQVLSTKDQRDHPDFHQQQMQTHTTIMVWECSRANGMGDWNMCKGTIEMKACIGIVQRHILPSRLCLSWEVHGQCQVSCVTTAWFCRDRLKVLDWPACSPV